MSDKIHRRVAEVLGMSIEDDSEDLQLGDEVTSLVPMPTEVVGVDNVELPCLHSELIRIEHGQQQTELLLERGISAVVTALDELPLLPPQYQPRARESAAELFKAVADLSKHNIEAQIKLVELKMKQATFTRNKSSANTLGTNNTFVISREELIKQFESKSRK